MSNPPWRWLSNGLPSTCQVCDRWPAQAICPACADRFAAPQRRCRVCALPLALGLAGADVCGHCQTCTEPALLRTCVAAVDYAYPWDTLIARFKFRGEPGWAGPMAALLLKNPQTVALWQQCDVAAPVPLTTERLASRGYNQAWELVKALRRAMPAETARDKTLADALLRIGEVPNQHSLTREQRLRNLQGVFVAHPFRSAEIANAQVLLVDDVSTTGATLHSAAQALLQAGAKTVQALVFARTPAH